MNLICFPYKVFIVQIICGYGYDIDRGIRRTHSRNESLTKWVAWTQLSNLMLSFEWLGIADFLTQSNVMLYYVAAIDMNNIVTILVYLLIVPRLGINESLQV